MLFDDFDDDEGVIAAPSCDHCGRFGQKYGFMIIPTFGMVQPMAVRLCREDCFPAVTRGEETLGERLAEMDSHPMELQDDE